MNPERRRRAVEIFTAALDLPAETRETFIVTSCGVDTDLRDFIAQLMQHDEAAESAAFLQTLPVFRELRNNAADDPPSPIATLNPGETLVNRYRIDSLIGRGGMGEVYRAWDLELRVPIALKTIRPEIAAEPVSLRRFKQEVLLARSVSHPNVCRIYDLGWDEPKGAFFLTMEYLPGETLSARIRRDGTFEPATGLPVIRQLAQALDAAHRAGIIHRDFKSANIMLVPAEGYDRAVITDFGLAVTTGTANDGAPAPDAWSGVRGPMGTVAYMSPEQVRGEPLEPASDLYALGVVLYEMSTGRLPFESPDPAEVARAHLRIQPVAPGIHARVDSAWEHTILRLLSKDPAERYPSAGDVVLALEERFTGEEGSRHALPAERDAFVGREPELAHLAAQLEREDIGQQQEARLLTLLGLGGIGKTRLAVRYGWESLPRWPGGVWFCDLSEARSREGIALAVATALNVPLGKTDPMVQLGHAIAGRGRCLIILDNFEQVVDHAETTLGMWLRRCTKASFLVTSRERLKLAGEVTNDVEPLDPATHGIGLFESRAQGHRPGFVVNDGNRQLVRELVTTLDGLPLAIELASSRLQMLSLHQIRDRLGDRFRTLTGGNRGRHATLRTTMDWSWDLLAPWEQAAVAQASVFEGGFALEAAEAVMELSSWPEAPPVLDVVHSLVNKSWLFTRPILDVPRFGMYATVQQYASEALRARGKSEGTGAIETETRHGAYYAALRMSGGASKQAGLRVDIDNLVAACRRAIQRADTKQSVETLEAAGEVLNLTGPVSVIVDLGQRLTGAPGLAPSGRARVLHVLGRALQIAGRSGEARSHFQDALAIYCEDGDRRSEARLLDSLGLLENEQGRVKEAREHFERALVIHRETGDRMLEAIVLGNRGNLQREQGRMEDALRDYEAALAIHRQFGSRRAEGATLGNLGVLHANQGRIDAARRCLEDALAIHREVGNRRLEGIALGNLGSLHHGQGDMEEARRHYEEALAILREVGDRRTESMVLGMVGRLDLEQGRTDNARRRLDQAIADLRDVDRLEHAKLLCIRCELALQENDRSVAESLLAQAQATAKVVGVSADSGLAREIARLREILAKAVNP